MISPKYSKQLMFRICGSQLSSLTVYVNNYNRKVSKCCQCDIFIFHKITEKMYILKMIFRVETAS